PSADRASSYKDDPEGILASGSLRAGTGIPLLADAVSPRFPRRPAWYDGPGAGRAGPRLIRTRCADDARHPPRPGHARAGRTFAPAPSGAFRAAMARFACFWYYGGGIGRNLHPLEAAVARVDNLAPRSKRPAADRRIPDGVTLCRRTRHGRPDAGAQPCMEKQQIGRASCREREEN